MSRASSLLPESPALNEGIAAASLIVTAAARPEVRDEFAARTW